MVASLPRAVMVYARLVFTRLHYVRWRVNACVDSAPPHRTRCVVNGSRLVLFARHCMYYCETTGAKRKDDE